MINPLFFSTVATTENILLFLPFIHLLFNHHHHRICCGCIWLRKPGSYFEWNVAFCINWCISAVADLASSAQYKLLSYSCSSRSSSRSSYWWCPRQRARASWCTLRPSSSRDCRPPARVKNWWRSQKEISSSSLVSSCQILFLWLFWNVAHQDSPFDLARSPFVVSLDSRSYHIVHDAWSGQH